MFWKTTKTNKPHRGNVIKPREAAVAPEVAWQLQEGDSSSLWTIVMTTPDGHFKVGP